MIKFTNMYIMGIAKGEERTLIICKRTPIRLTANYIVETMEPIRQ